MTTRNSKFDLTYLREAREILAQFIHFRTAESMRTKALGIWAWNMTSAHLYIDLRYGSKMYACANVTSKFVPVPSKDDISHECVYIRVIHFF